MGRKSAPPGADAPFRAYFDDAPDALFVHDEVGRVVDANQKACETLAYSREDIIGKRLRDFDANPGRNEWFTGITWERLDAGETLCFETLQRRKDGSVFPVEVNVRPFSRDGRRLAMSSVRDITRRREHKFAEAQLREREQALRDLIETIPAIAWTIRSDGSDIFASKRWTQYTGLPAGALSGSEWLAVIHPSELAVHTAKWRESVEHGVPFENEARLRRADGEYRWFLVRAVPLSDERGNVLKWYGLATDIEDRKRAEQASRASEERFRTLVQFSFDVYWETDTQHRFIMQEFGEHVADAPARGSEIGKTRWEVPYLEPDEDAWRNHRATLDAHLPFRDFELARRNADGGKRYVSVSGFPIFDETGRFIGYRGVGRHISDLKRAEEERRAHLWFLESMDRINRAIQATRDLEHMMSEVLRAALEIFSCDRAWLVYPCDPHAPSWHAVMEHTRPEYPGAFALGTQFPISADVAAVFSAALAAPGAVQLGPGRSPEIPSEVAEQFAIRSVIAMAIDAKSDKPYLLGLHQCSREREWTAPEERLLQEVGRRLGDALASLSALRSLRDSERKLEAAQKLAHVGWWERDLITKRVALSQEVQRIFGVGPLDLPHWQDRWVNLIHPNDRAKTAAAAVAALERGPRYDVEYRVVRPDGSVRVVHSQGDVTWDESGRPLRQFGVLQDITERRQSEDELAEIKERFRILAESSLTGIYVTHLDRFSYVNPAMATMFGYSVEEIVGGLGSLDLTCAEDRSLVSQNMRRRLEGDVEDLRYEFRGLRKDGSVFPVEVHGRRINYGGKIGVLGTLVDNTERKRAEDALRASEARFRTFVDHARDAFFLLDEQLTVVDVNRQACDSLGYSREELIGMHPRDFDAGLDEQSIARLAERALAGETLTFETRHRRRDETKFPVEIRAHTFQQGGKAFLLALVRDITERKRAEEELRATEARYGTLVDFAADAFMLHAEDGKVIDVNRQACETLGYTRDELIGMMPADFDAGLDADALRQVVQRVGRGETLTIETRHRRKDGSLVPVEVRLRQIQEGERSLNISLSRDITERKRGEEEREMLRRLEADLTRMSRVITMGELTASIAHEVNQPLAAMVANAAACERWLAAKPPETAKARKALKSISADGRRASAVIGRIRALMKRQPPRKEPLDMNEAIHEVLALARQQLRNSDVMLRLADELPRVDGDKVQLQQVLLNLIANAIDAMYGIDGRRRELTIVSRQDGPSVVIEVHDSGIGLDPQHAERLFEPFYTTKEEGTGIGLAISRSIVEAHEGRMWAVPNVPQGAVFLFSLPVHGNG
jgi:PAS domain S-box-containing protein